MYPVSEAFLEAVTRDHTIATRVDLLATDTTTGQVTVIDLGPINDGNVSIDKRNAIRSTGSLTVIDEDGVLVPDDLADLLAPNGNEFRPWRGVRYPDGSEELVPLATLGIESSSVQENNGAVSIALAGKDRAARVSRAKFTEQFVLLDGIANEDAITAIINSRVPGLHFDVGALPVNATLPNMVISEQADPWAEAIKLAKEIGCELYFDRMGAVQLQAELPPTARAVVAAFLEADPASNKFMNPRRQLSRDGIVNHWIVTGEGTGITTPVRAEAQDERPSSPTYVHGPFGDCPRWYKSTRIKTQAQAQATANALLSGSLGMIEDVQTDALVNPALDVSDAVQIERARTKITGVFLLDSLRLPLRAKRAMSFTTRTR